MKFLIGIPLPLPLQKLIGRLCFGLSNVSWFDPFSFHIALHPLQTSDPSKLIDIAQILKEIDFPPFFLSLHGVERFSNDHAAKTLGIALSPSVDLQKLKATILQKLREAGSHKEKNGFTPYIPIGHISSGNETKLGMFLMENSSWAYSPLLVTSFALFEVQTTAKHTFCSVVGEFPLKKEAS